MTIKKIYEIYCDNCSATDHSFNSIKDTEKEWVECGGIVRGKKHFCSEKCFQEHNKKNKE